MNKHVHTPFRGWYCTIEGPHQTCAAWPKWWNIRGMIELWRHMS